MPSAECDRHGHVALPGQTVFPLFSHGQDHHFHDTVTVSTEVDIKENTIVSKKDELSLSSPSEEFIKFNQWLEEHCPFVLKVKTQMTEPEYQKLLAKYTKKEISDVLESLNNWKDFPKKRTNVYRSTLDELKKKFGER